MNIGLGYLMIFLTVGRFAEARLKFYAKISPHFRQKGHLNNIFEDRMFTTTRSVIISDGLGSPNINAGPFAELVTHYLYYNFYHKAKEDYSKKALGLTIEEAVKKYNEIMKKHQYDPLKYQASAGFVACFLRKDNVRNYLDIAVMGMPKALLLNYEVSKKTGRGIFNMRFQTPERQNEKGIPRNVFTTSKFGQIMPDLDLTRHSFMKSNIIVMGSTGVFDNLPIQIVILLTNLVHYTASQVKAKVRDEVLKNLMEIFKKDYIEFLKRETHNMVAGSQIDEKTFNIKLLQDPSLEKFKKYIFFNPDPHVDGKNILKNFNKLSLSSG